MAKETNQRLISEEEKANMKGFAEWLSGLIISNYNSGGTWVVKFEGFGKAQFMTTEELIEKYFESLNK